MTSKEDQENSQENPLKAEEEKLRKKYGNFVMKMPAAHILQSKQKYFDSGDYNMARAQSVKHPTPLSMCTGDKIPTLDTVPCARKKSTHLASNHMGLPVHQISHPKLNNQDGEEEGEKKTPGNTDSLLAQSN